METPEHKSGGVGTTVHSKEHWSSNIHFGQVLRSDEHEKIEHTCRPLSADEHMAFLEGPTRKQAKMFPQWGLLFPQQPSSFLFK